MTAPPPPPTLEDHAPLAFGRHTGTRERDGAFIGWSSRTGAIGDPAVRWWACNEQWAPDGLPWPLGWSLELFQALPGNHRLVILAGARRRAPRIAASTMVEQVGPDVGSNKPMLVRCRRTGRVGEMSPKNVLLGVALGHQGRRNTILLRRGYEAHLARLQVYTPLFDLGGWRGVTQVYPYRCGRCGGVHEMRAASAAAGRRPRSCRG